MSRPSEGLDTAIEAYRLNRDVLKIARRVVDASDERHLRTTGFLGLAHGECGGELEKMQDRLDEITVMVLWSTFERWLIDHVTRVTRNCRLPHRKHSRFDCVKRSALRLSSGGSIRSWIS